MRIITRYAYEGKYLKDIDAYLRGFVVLNSLLLLFIICCCFCLYVDHSRLCLMNDAFRDKGHIKMRTSINKTHYIFGSILSRKSLARNKWRCAFRYYVFKFYGLKINKNQIIWYYKFF